MFRIFSRPWLILSIGLAGLCPGQTPPPAAPAGSTAVETTPQTRVIPAPPAVPVLPGGPDKTDAAAPPVSARLPASGAAVVPSRQPQAAFDRAVIAYKAGALAAAREEFLTIFREGHLSAALAHNLGNIEFRSGNPGQAALWYRRALAIDPFSPETLQNLRTLRRQQGFLSFDPLLLSLSHINPRWISQGTILAAWLVGLLLVWLLVVPPSPGRRWPLVTLLLLALPLLALGAVLTWQVKTDPHPLAKRLVISGKATQAFAAPAEASSTVIALPAGSEVLPLEVRGHWIYCIIPGGEAGEPLRGWVRTTYTEPLWPWDGGLRALPAKPVQPSPDPSAA